MGGDDIECRTRRQNRIGFPGVVPGAHLQAASPISLRIGVNARCDHKMAGHLHSRSAHRQLNVACLLFPTRKAGWGAAQRLVGPLRLDDGPLQFASICGPKRDVVGSESRFTLRTPVSSQSPARKLSVPARDVRAIFRVRVERAHRRNPAVPFSFQDVSRARNTEHPGKHSFPLPLRSAGCGLQAQPLNAGVCLRLQQVWWPTNKRGTDIRRD
jgi:hypothetical protein